MANHVYQRRAGQGANWIERKIAEQLDPNLGSNPCGNRTAKTRGDERLGDHPAPLRARTVRLSQTDSISFDVLDHARLEDLGREVRERPDDTGVLDRCRNHTPGIHLLEADTFQL